MASFSLGYCNTYTAIQNPFPKIQNTCYLTLLVFFSIIWWLDVKILSSFRSNPEVVWVIAPVLDEGNLNLPGVDLGHGTDLLGHLDTLLDRLQLGDQLGDLLAHRLRLHLTLLYWLADDDGLHLLSAHWISLESKHEI